MAGDERFVPTLLTVVLLNKFDSARNIAQGRKLIGNLLNSATLPINPIGKTPFLQHLGFSSVYDLPRCHSYGKRREPHRSLLRERGYGAILFYLEGTDCRMGIV